MARVALINPAGVNPSDIERICETSDLPQGEIRLLVGDPYLHTEFQAVTIPRALIVHAANLFGLQEHVRETWDCGVIIGEFWARRQVEFPAYFAYLVAHEFGHASTVLKDLGLTIYEDMILSYVPRIVPHKKWRWDEMPHEILYDRFGIAVAEEIYGRHRIELEFSTLISNGLSSDVPRMRKVLELTPTKDLSSLKNDLAAFATEFKDDLLREWQKDIDRGALKMARHLPSLDALWRAS